MRKTVLNSLITALCLISAVLVAQQIELDTAPREPVVVELFTSEGCSSCPPADKVLSELAEEGGPDGIRVIPIAYHVDYWNYIGWEDPYSLKDANKRQYSYAERMKRDGIYTPQMLIDGRVEFVGSNATKAAAEIRKAAAVEKVRVYVTEQRWREDGRLLVTAGVRGDGLSQETQLLMLLTEDNLTQQIAAGENKGRTLHHDGVVREVMYLTLEQQDPRNYTATAPLNMHPDADPAQTSLVILVEKPEGGILGATKVPMKQKPE